MKSGEGKRPGSWKTRLQSICIYAALFGSAILASVTASLLVEQRYAEALRNDLFEKISDKANDMVASVEEAFESALLMNLYALDNNLYQEDSENGTRLNNYTLYTTLKYIQNYSPYFTTLMLYDEESNLVYDSTASVSRVESHFDNGIKILANQTKDQSATPTDQLVYYYRTALKANATRTQVDYYNAMTAVFSTRKGRHVLVNMNLDRLYADFQREVSEICRAETVLAGDGAGMLISGLEREQAENILAQTVFDGKLGSWTDAAKKENTVMKFSFLNADLDFYVVVSETTLRQMTREAMVEIQQVQILMFGVYLLIFTLFIFLFMRPLAKMLRASLTEETRKDFAPAQLSVKGMLQVVIDKNKEMARQQADTFPIYVANLLAALLTEKTADPGQTARELQSYGIELGDGPYFACAVEVGASQDSPEEIQLRKRFIVKRCNEMLEPGKGFAVDLNGGLIGLACTDPRGREEILRLAEGIRQQLLTKINMHSIITVGSRPAGLMQLKKSFDEAVNALSCRIIFDEAQVIDCERIQVGKGLLTVYFAGVESELLCAIRLGDAGRVEAVLAGLFRFIEEHGYELSMREVADVSVQILASVGKVLEEYGASPAKVMEKPIYELYKMITASTRKELWDLLNKIAVAAACSIGVGEAGQEGRKSRTVKKICNYIGENYASDISLEIVADYVGLNASYVSSAFKEVMGQSFSSYLEEKRMEAAVTLIQTSNLKIAQIAQQVGYNSPNYFSKAFRKKMGVPPDQYRNLVDR